MRIDEVKVVKVLCDSVDDKEQLDKTAVLNAIKAYLGQGNAKIGVKIDSGGIAVGAGIKVVSSQSPVAQAIGWSCREIENEFLGWGETPQPAKVTEWLRKFVPEAE